ncbi:MAG: aromatic ring-hydroxylating dioxygenase subunit alpha [Pseudomonadota bacterium]|nr:aromatic ring-hydroxylating dioxygenase subunit alpha [Pseudomonadota bacterium]
MAARHETPDMPAHLKLFAALVADPAGMKRRAAAVTSVDAGIYLSPDRFEAERRKLFRRYPILVAHASELPEPGCMLAHDHLGVPILLARGRDGTIRAFLNACRHRNTKLVKPGEEKKRPSIVCPYHSWTYGLDGALLSIPCEDQFPGVEKSGRGLVPLPCAVRNGLVFVVPDPAGSIDIDGFLAGLDVDFEAFGVETSVMFRKVEQAKRTNWKLVVDAFQDGYHIQHLHRHTIAPFFKDCVSINERTGDHLRAVVARDTFDEAMALPPELWSIREHATYSHYVFPNTIFIMHPDYISIIGLFPVSPGETMYTHRLLTPHAPRNDKERDHYERSFDLIENGVFQAEDLDVSERAQGAMEGGATWPMTLGAMETGIRMFHDILDEALARN